MMTAIAMTMIVLLAAALSSFVAHFPIVPWHSSVKSQAVVVVVTVVVKVADAVLLFM